MKNLYFVLLVTILFISCSDELSNSKAEDIIEDCLEKSPKMEKLYFYVGEREFEVDKEKDLDYLEKLKKLNEAKIITLDSIKYKKKVYRFQSDKLIYKIAFTEKAKDFIIDSGDDKNGLRKATIKTCDFEVDKVLQVHEIPSLNTAEVTVSYEKINKNPFSILSSKLEDFENDKVTFKKTSNGWVYCN